jgi:hypothetical protein
MGSLRNPVACWARDRMIQLIPRKLIVKSLVDLGRPPEWA